MRGTYATLDGFRRSARIIPAGAGHFPRLGFFAVAGADHPRRCGALSALGVFRGRRGGSSPQVRGTYSSRSTSKSLRGIIPAGAGHFAFYQALAEQRGGSSPQVRGTSAMSYLRQKCTRIIPAGAGHLQDAIHHQLAPRDHPRRCGALHRRRKMTVLAVGSSPQVRGTSRRDCPIINVPGDHPRRCGALPTLVFTMI